MSLQRFPGDDLAWQQIVNQLGSTSPYQSHSWAKFRLTDGWECLRLISDDQNAAIQILTKRYFGVSVGWAPGGPLGSPSADLIRELPSLVRSQTSSTATYIRVSDFRTEHVPTHDQYLQSGWYRPRTTLASGLTLTRSLPQSSERLRSSYSKNWSRNLRRGEERLVTANRWDFPAAGEIASLHRSVVETKGLSVGDWRTSQQRLSEFTELFQSDLVVVRALDELGNVCAIRGAVICGSTGFDFLAATSNDGRKLYASNVALHQLFIELIQKGVTTYDFGGVDPIANKGVYDFKHGAGGTEIRYEGEYETSSPSALRIPLSTLVSLRLR